MGVGFAVLLAPGHGAETNEADLEAAAAEWAVFHREDPSLSGGGWPDYATRGGRRKPRPVGVLAMRADRPAGLMPKRHAGTRFRAGIAAGLIYDK
ncbi:hypothetical protein NH8B_0431 [Pseudogulbenkiania sp. NH8B]|nr:hypothetical protein NH8B_0431 [Pseudogulbenkiania sp. NH8B]